MKLNLNNLSISKETLYYAARGIAIVAACFSVFVIILLLANYLQTKSIDPLNSKALDVLLERLQENPDNQDLKDEIRALDLLSRKAFFTSRWQLRMGSYLLVGGIIVLLLSLKFMKDLKRALPHPEGCPDSDDSWLQAILARKWVTYGSAALLFIALGTAFISHNELADDDIFKNSSKIPSQEELMKNWANFRGPGGNGVAPTNKSPISWDGKSGRGIKWKVEIPRQGYSSPVVWKDQVYLTGADEKVREVYCYNAANGELRWRKEVSGIPGSPEQAPNVHKDTKYAAPSVATDGRYVCAIFPNADLICLDLAGNRTWAQNLGVPENHYGHASSLIIHENILIVQYDQNSNSRLLGLDVATGNTMWIAERSVISWSSPICVNTGKRMELILTNSKAVDSYDPVTGVKLWGENCLSGEMGPSAAYAAGMVFVANDYAVVAGIRITEDGAELVWEYDDNLPDTASPLATEKYVFIATSYGFLACLDAKTGEFLWEYEFGDGFYASPILVGDNVYAMDLQGIMHIFKADKEYKPIADNKLGETSACTPAFVDNVIYIRGDKNLYCINGD